MQPRWYFIRVTQTQWVLWSSLSKEIPAQLDVCVCVCVCVCVLCVCVCVIWPTLPNKGIIGLCWTFHFLSFFLGRACQRNDLASLVSESVTPQPIVALENCLGFRIVPSSGRGIVGDQYCFFFYKITWVFFFCLFFFTSEFWGLFRPPPKHTQQNPTLVFMSE